MTAEVFFASARVEHNRGILQRFVALLGRMGLPTVAEGDVTAIKVHFGDDGTTAYVRPQFARKLVDQVKRQRARPFLTDTCTLYRGRRQHAVDHLELALENGFGYATVGAPLVIGDGIGSRDVAEVAITGRHFDQVRYASAVYHADALICLSHVKGHLAVGFGGTIKNLSMGLGSRGMKQAMHASVSPKVDAARCEGCGECVSVCPEDAVSLVDGVARFDLARCAGCGECIAVCDPGALAVQWNEQAGVIQEKMVEVAGAVLAAKVGKCAYFNVVMDVTPDCDCFPWSDNPLVNNIGVLGAFDPVAIDQAAADLVNAACGLPDCRLSANALAPGSDKFADLYPKIDWQHQLAYAEAAGLGTRAYTLTTVE